MDIKGLIVNKVLVIKVVDIDVGIEYYVGMIVDCNVQSYILMVFVEGGMEIEEVVVINFEKIICYCVDLVIGLCFYEVCEVVIKVGFRGNLNKIVDMMVKMSKVVFECDVVLVEINLFFVDVDGIFIVLDIKFEIDDNVMYCYKDFVYYCELFVEYLLEVEVSDYGFVYVKLDDGNVGVLGNGVGIVMIILDVVNCVGVKFVNFFDIGGGVKVDVVYNVVKLVSKDFDVKVIFINIFGGIICVDEVVKGVICVLDEGILIKLVCMCIVGIVEDEVKVLLNEKNSDLIKMYFIMFEVVNEVVKEVNVLGGK